MQGKDTERLNLFYEVHDSVHLHDLRGSKRTQKFFKWRRLSSFSHAHTHTVSTANTPLVISRYEQRIRQMMGGHICSATNVILQNFDIKFFLLLLLGRRIRE